MRVEAQPYLGEAAATTSWEEAGRRLAEGDTFWLATTHPGGRPHLTPVLAVWVADGLHFCSGPGTRKARNLVHDARCAIGASTADLDLVLRGTARKVSDERRLRDVAAAYAGKYDWHVTVRDGAFHDTEGAPTAGPPPYDVYELVPEIAFGFPAHEGISATRWRFER